MPAWMTWVIIWDQKYFNGKEWGIYLGITTARLCADCSMSFEKESKGAISLSKLPRNGKTHGASTDHLIYEYIRLRSERLRVPTTCVKSALSTEELENGLGAHGLVNWRRKAPPNMSRTCFTVWMWHDGAMPTTHRKTPSLAHITC